jgi:hypothetical protein
MADYPYPDPIVQVTDAQELARDLVVIPNRHVQIKRDHLVKSQDRDCMHVRLLEFGRSHDLLLGASEHPGARRGGGNPLVSVAHARRGRWTRTC